MASFADTALRTFESSFAPLLKGLSLPAFAPLILLAFLAFFVFKLFFADAAPQYNPFAHSVGLTAANLWNSRNELGLSPPLRGRTLASMEPLVDVLDALSNAITKYETGPAPNAYLRQRSKVRFQ